MYIINIIIIMTRTPTYLDLEVGIILLDQCTTTKHNRLLNLSMTNMSMTSTS